MTKLNLRDKMVITREVPPLLPVQDPPGGRGGGERGRRGSGGGERRGERR